MKGYRLIALSAFAWAILPALSATGEKLAPLLPEVTKYLSQAHDEMSSGDFGAAKGHAAAVLLGDDLSYNVTYNSATPGEEANCDKALRAAFSIWEHDLGDSVHFHEVASDAHPQIAIVFKPAVKMGEEQVAGYTSWQRRIEMDGKKWVGTTFHADMQLRTRDLEFKPMSYEALRHEACHETGHILGLDDSEHIGDLMGPLQISHPVGAPRDLEAASVRSVRDEAKQIETDALDREAGK